MLNRKWTLAWIVVGCLCVANVYAGKPRSRPKPKQEELIGTPSAERELPSPRRKKTLSEMEAPLLSKIKLLRELKKKTACQKICIAWNDDDFESAVEVLNTWKEEDDQLAETIQSMMQDR